MTEIVFRNFQLLVCFGLLHQFSVAEFSNMLFSADISLELIKICAVTL
jgi:hypothetical protein